MNEQKNEELRKAIEEVIGQKVDHFLIVARSRNGACFHVWKNANGGLSVSRNL